jgi:hypothetical protein
VIKTADSCPKQAEDFALALMQALDEVIDLTLHRDMDPVNPGRAVEKPIVRWAAWGVG